MHYVIGDIHGQIRELKRLLKKLDLKPEDKVYFVGDWFDRAYTEKDIVEMVQWMLENLTSDSQFRTVLGNHDMDQLDRINFYNMRKNKNSDADMEWRLMNIFSGSDEAQYIRSCYPRLKSLIESMPLYEKFVVNGQEYVVTHSWLRDKEGHPLGERGFEWNNLDVYYSVWDRDYSVNKVTYEEDIPIVIHGHTPTLGRHDIWTDGCKALAKIMKVTEKNIDVDCCAFYSPLRGGNLAAYRCEDGAEFYAYEERDFYELVDKCMDRYSAELLRGELNITKREWYFAVLFGNYGRVFHPKENKVPLFECERAEEMYKSFRELFADCDEQEFVGEILRYESRAKRRLDRIVGKYWVLCREEDTE